MTETHLRPRSVSEIVDAAFVLYRKHAPRYMVATALSLAPLIIVQLWMTTPEEILAQDAGTVAVSSVMSEVLLVAFVSIVSYALIGGVLLHMGSRAYLGHDPDVGEAFGVALPRIPALTIAMIGKSILFVIGALMLFVGLLYFAARYFAVEAAVVLEGKGAIASFGRSSELSKDRKRHILSTLVLVGFVYLCLTIGVSLLAELSGSHVISVLVSNGLSAVTFPIFQLSILVLYYDARIRGEGFDLEHMASSLDRPAPAGA